MGKYIRFEKENHGDKIYIINKKPDAIIGYIYWYPIWKSYVFVSKSMLIVWSTDCLDDVSTELKRLNKKGEPDHAKRSCHADN